MKHQVCVPTPSTCYMSCTDFNRIAVFNDSSLLNAHRPISFHFAGDRFPCLFFLPNRNYYNIRVIFYFSAHTKPLCSHRFFFFFFTLYYVWYANHCKFCQGKRYIQLFGHWNFIVGQLRRAWKYQLAGNSFSGILTATCNSTKKKDTTSALKHVMRASAFIVITIWELIFTKGGTNGEGWAVVVRQW